LFIVKEVFDRDEAWKKASMFDLDSCENRENEHGIGLGM